MSTPPIAVAVVSWNTRELLDRCLASLAADAQDGRAEVWVVDNASTDGSADAARAHGFAQVIALEEGLGYAPALERVREETTAPWIACANADTAVCAGAVAQLLATGAADPRTGAVAPRLRLPDGSTQRSVHAFPSARSFARARLRGADGDPDLPRRVDWAYGAFLLVRRAAVEAAGGFGAERRLYGEDLDLAWRLAAAGWTMAYDPAAVVEHHESAATTQAWGDQRHDLRAAAGYAWLAGRRGRASAAGVAAVEIGHAVGRAAGALARDPRGTGWRAPLGEARREARGLRAGLRDDRWRTA